MTVREVVDPRDLRRAAEHVERLLLPRHIVEVTEARNNRVDARAVKECVVAAQRGKKLHEFFKFSDEELGRPNLDWVSILEQLSKHLGGASLESVSASQKANLDTLQNSLNRFSGLAKEHMLYLSNVAVEGFALRQKPVTWADPIFRPKEGDPRTLVNWNFPPETVNQALSRWNRIHMAIDPAASGPGPSMELVSSLF